MNSTRQNWLKRYMRLGTLVNPPLLATIAAKPYATGASCYQICSSGKPHAMRPNGTGCTRRG